MDSDLKYKFSVVTTTTVNDPVTSTIQPSTSKSSSSSNNVHSTDAVVQNANASLLDHPIDIRSDNQGEISNQ